MIAVQFNKVTKSFPRHAGQMLLRQRLANWIRGAHREQFSALSDVSFEVEQGECLGIIGLNGAGKSTTLNLITGLCRPTSGSITVSGKVAALLELGAGFHHDLTGAENVTVNAALLGLTEKETRERFPEIVKFADIGDFIDEPLRTYSSGMLMRLAFAVAVHVDPDILVLDELLGVGDQDFSEKCVDRIRAFRRAGKTMICVSHSLLLIESLCDRSLWLDHGRVMRIGPTSQVVRAYHETAREAGSPYLTLATRDGSSKGVVRQIGVGKVKRG
jgi:lipopolysaccharide transport system ATP-binding protein